MKNFNFINPIKVCFFLMFIPIVFFPISCTQSIKLIQRMAHNKQDTGYLLLGKRTVDYQGNVVSSSTFAGINKITQMNSASQLLSGIRNDGTLINRNYDLLGYLLSQNVKTPTGQTIDSASFSKTYDPKTHWLSSITDISGKTNFDYYPDGKLYKQIFPNQDSLTYTYNYSGKVKQFVDSFGNKVSYTYNSSGKLYQTSILDNINHKNYLATFYYNDQGKMKEIDLPFGFILKLHYNEFSLIDGYQYYRIQSSSKTKNKSYLVQVPILKQALTYDPDTKIKTKTIAYYLSGKLQNTANSSYNYDEQGRLKIWTCQGKACPLDHSQLISSENFSYDNYNNLTQQITTYQDSTQGPKTIQFVYSKDNPFLLSEVKTTQGGQTKSYFPKYNTQGQIIDDGKGHQYGYLANRLVKIEKGTQKENLIYNPKGKLIQQSISGKNQNNPPLINEYDISGKLIDQRQGTDKAFDWENGHFLNANPPEMELKGTGKNVLQNYDASGKLAFQNSYTPYGKTNAQNSSSEPLIDHTQNGYKGKTTDTLSGVVFMGARAYSPDLKRFLSPDEDSPFGDGGINPYSFVNDDPINNFDPTGHSTFSAIFGQIALNVLGTLVFLFTGVIPMLGEAIVAGNIALSAVLITGTLFELVGSGLSAASTVASLKNNKNKNELASAASAVGFVSMAINFIGSAILAPIQGIEAELNESLEETLGATISRPSSEIGAKRTLANAAGLWSKSQRNLGYKILKGTGFKANIGRFFSGTKALSEEDMEEISAQKNLVRLFRGKNDLEGSENLGKFNTSAEKLENLAKRINGNEQIVIPEANTNEPFLVTEGNAKMSNSERLWSVYKSSINSTDSIEFSQGNGVNFINSEDLAVGKFQFPNKGLLVRLNSLIRYFNENSPLLSENSNSYVYLGGNYNKFSTSIHL